MADEELKEYNRHFGEEGEINEDGYMKYTRGVMQMHPDHRYHSTGEWVSSSIILLNRF